MFGDRASARTSWSSGIGYKGDFGGAAPKLNETIIMLVVLGLIDVVMISNLLIMVIVGGYETFVSRMDLEGHPDQPEWLCARERLGAEGQARHRHHRHHLDPPAQDLHQRRDYTEKVLLYQTVIHVTFLLSALAIACTDRLMRGESPSAARLTAPH